MNCSICGKVIVLAPSAKERASKYGETPAFYTKLFTVHAECLVAERDKETYLLMRKIKEL